MTVIIDGKKVAEKVREQIRQEVEKLSEKPTIAVVIVGENPASKVYVASKHKAAASTGMNSIVIELNEKISQQELESRINELNTDKGVNGILVQLPLPKHINANDIIQRILPEKDVDGFHPVNVGKLSIGLDPYAISCTPNGIIRLLDEYNIPIEGKNAVIIGRSNIVGKPMAALLLNRSATVTVCHSRTKDIEEVVKQADIIVAAVGIQHFVKANWVKEGSVVIDVGINRTNEGKLTGDVDFENIKDKASYITPVPGGVGPMTIALLLENTLRLYKLQKR